MFWMPCPPEPSSTHDKERKAAAQSRERFGAGGTEYQIRPARDLRTRRAAFQLIHELYVEKGYTEPLESGMWVSVFDFLPDTVTLVVEREETIVGTLTVVFDGELGLPSDLLYRKEVNTLRGAGRVPSEIISLGVAGEGRSASRHILVKLFNYVYMTAWYLRGSTDFVITVNPRHADYYRKTLLFEQSGSEKNYGKVGGAPAVLMHLPLETPTIMERPENHRARQRTHYRFFHTLEEEDEILPALEGGLEPMTEKEFCYFAMQKTDVWEKASLEEKLHLSGHYLTAMLAMDEKGHLSEPAGIRPEPARDFLLIRGGAA